VTHPGTIAEQPWNAATPAAALQQHLTPNDRSSYETTSACPDWTQRYLLRMEATGRRATSFTPDLKSLPQQHITAVLECAGNGGHPMVPRPRLPWSDGAMGCAPYSRVRWYARGNDGKANASAGRVRSRSRGAAWLGGYRCW
jgi:Oxidoreductase molybdopterin binding domain